VLDGEQREQQGIHGERGRPRAHGRSVEARRHDGIANESDRIEKRAEEDQVGERPVREAGDSFQHERSPQKRPR
jgi:hypothetical protein